MSDMQIFTVEEARKILPQLRQMIMIANDQLEEISKRLEKLNDAHAGAELALASFKTGSTQVADLQELRNCRERLDKAATDLACAQQDYLDCLNGWVERISDTGVILRDIKSGLLDFPAKQGDFEYLLCWNLSDDDITHWHLLNDGFIGRKPLAALLEYF